ncbi:MAG TPA: DUF1049 domain-containing protein [Isosphaeraceae bacterium]|nr:DUF1049 domain-containing protein [Isosphaeraceae bacterium]
MAYQYKRRKLAIIRNFWVYRRLIGTAVLLGLILWFIWANSAPAIVKFPFGLGAYTSTVGVVILLTALVSSIATILVVTLILALKRIRGAHSAPEPPHRAEQPGDHPPPDYAAKTTEGFSNAQWSN